VVGTLHRIAGSGGRVRRVASWACWPGLLGQPPRAAARYLLRLVTGGLRLGIGTPAILDALAQVHAGGRAARPVQDRACNLCCDLGAPG
jgi:DNA ligase-1